MATAFKNPDSSIVLVVFNLLEADKHYTIDVNGRTETIAIPGQALHSIVIPAAEK
jgi:hypothetical protein